MKFDLLRFPVLACLFALTACGTPQGRLLDDDEEDLVGGTTAGAATYDRIVNGATKELLNKYVDRVLEGEAPNGINVAFAGIYNKQREELGEWRDELNQVVDTVISDFDGFDTVSQRYVAAGLREKGLTVDDLLLPAKRRQFFEVLEIKSGNPVKALVFGTITGGGQGVGQKRQQRYRLTLEMIDSETGKNLKASDYVRKEYNR